MRCATNYTTQTANEICMTQSYIYLYSISITTMGGKSSWKPHKTLSGTQLSFRRTWMLLRGEQQATNKEFLCPQHFFLS